jgi:hypothetical protein
MRSTRASPRMSRRRNGPLQMGHSCLFFSRSVRQVLHVRDYGAAQQCCAMSGICCMQRRVDDHHCNELHMRSWELTNTGSGSRLAARTVASGCRCCRQKQKRLLSTVSRTWPHVLLHLYHPADVHITMAWCSMQSLTQPHQRGHLSSSARPLSATSFSGVSSSIDAHLPTAGCSAAGAFGAKRGSALRAVAKSRWSQQHVSYTQ